MNNNNFGMVAGRLTKDIITFKNKGYIKAIVTIAVKNNYKNKDGKKDTQFITLEKLFKEDKVKKNKDGSLNLGAFSRMHKGDLVSISYELRNNDYIDKDGNPVYGIKCIAKDITFLENKQTTEKRIEKNLKNK